MSTLIVYYSLTGHVKNLVKKIEDNFDFDTLEIKTKSDFQYKGPLKFIVGGFQSLNGYCPAIQDTNVNFNNYSKFIFITPIWAGGYAPAFNSFLTKYDFANKEIILITSSGASNDSAIEKFKQKLPMSKITNSFSIHDKKNEEIDLVIESLKNSYGMF
ncbi:flavodoxin [Clostridiaceae bacterium HSG29]|nr:flavodoxin [Clostridiaceae bacterium HSG29]